MMPSNLVIYRTGAEAEVVLLGCEVALVKEHERSSRRERQQRLWLTSASSVLCPSQHHVEGCNFHWICYQCCTSLSGHGGKADSSSERLQSKVLKVRLPPEQPAQYCFPDKVAAMVGAAA